MPLVVPALGWAGATPGMPSAFGGVLPSGPGAAPAVPIVPAGRSTPRARLASRAHHAAGHTHRARRHLLQHGLLHLHPLLHLLLLLLLLQMQMHLLAHRAGLRLRTPVHRRRLTAGHAWPATHHPTHHPTQHAGRRRLRALLHPRRHQMSHLVGVRHQAHLLRLLHLRPRLLQSLLHRRVIRHGMRRIRLRRLGLRIGLRLSIGMRLLLHHRVGLRRLRLRLLGHGLRPLQDAAREDGEHWRRSACRASTCGRQRAVPLQRAP